ncbi:MAG: RNA pseudouridine synthase [Planctomycetes bacterium]|nr:RNA pseudouridine synthase [Planctomycetota bacterium]
MTCEDSPAPDPDWLLLEDGPLIAVNKPVGFLTEGPVGGPPSIVNDTKAWLASKYEKPGNVYLGIPHRLDRATSGVLVFGKNSKVSRRLSEQFFERAVTKKYLAILDEPPDPAEGLLVDWLRKDRERAISEVVAPDSENAKEARLEYRTLGPIDGGALVEVTLITGRMHQIRVQFASRGWPVIGDTKYGGREWEPTDDSGLPAERIALHARSLTLKHPIRYDDVTIEAAMPAHWPSLET